MTSDQFRFLCLGNSLTAGYPGYGPSSDGISHGHGNAESQYEHWLKLRCIEDFSGEEDLGQQDVSDALTFINKGIPGELTSNILARIDRDLLSVKPKPDYSILIGGTNDLGWGVENRKILPNIRKLHGTSREFGIHSIGATIPPIRSERSSKEYHRRKADLNEQLRTYFRKEGIPFADLYAGMSDEEGNLKSKCAHFDGLHFSVEGYRQMGTIIYEDAVKAILEDQLGGN